MLYEYFDICLGVDNLGRVFQLVASRLKSLATLFNYLAKLLHIVLHKVYLGRVVFHHFVQRGSILAANLIHTSVYLIQLISVLFFGLFCRIKG